MKRSPHGFRLPKSNTDIHSKMVSNRIHLGGAGWSGDGQCDNCCHITEDIEAMLTAEDVILIEGDLLGLNLNSKRATVENYNTALMGAMNWFLSGLYGWFDKKIQPVWYSMEFLLRSFMLTPVGAYPVVSWSQRMPEGTIAKDSPQCKLMEGFQDVLVGLETRSIVVSAGSTSYSCTNENLAKKITDAISNPGSDVDFFCDGADWNVGICGNALEISIGHHIEKSICDCQADLTIRPCHGHNNWGGLNGGCGQGTITLSVVVYYGTSFAPTPNPTYLPITSADPTETPTNEPTAMPVEFPTSAPPTPNPTSLPIASENPTETPTIEPTAMPVESPTAAPSDMQTQIYDPTNETYVLQDFDSIDKDGNGVLSYEEIIFDIADLNKNGDISPEEYLAARADGLFTDRSARN